MTPDEIEKWIGQTEKRMSAFEGVLKELTKRVTVADDIEKIKQLQYRYINALIQTNWDDVMDCFSENATFYAYLPKREIKGKAAIEKWFKESIAKNHVGKEGDFVVHPIISVDGDKAKGSWLLYMMYCYPRTGQSLFWVQGYYDIEYVKENGTWKFGYFKWAERMGLPGGGPPTGLT